jgi:uncharacterized protein (DUF58 family)
MDQIPQMSQNFQGLLLFLFGLVLFLHVTNILVFGTKTIILLAALALMAYGFMKMNGMARLKRLLKK